MYSNNFLKTISLAARLHKNQSRKDILQTPYITHLTGVAFLLSCVTKDEDILLAGLMHDSLEDVPDYTFEDLIADCGQNVANIVLDVTEEKSLPYIERKNKYLQHLETVSFDSLIVSVADKYHNIMSMSDMINKNNFKSQLIVIEGVCDIATRRIDQNHQYYILVLQLQQAIRDFKIDYNII